jgi:hypothetical protein
LRGDFHGYIFVPLLEESEASRSLELLTARLSAEPSVPVACVNAPLAGLQFFTAMAAVSQMLDHWWEATVPADRLPVLLLLHEPGLERWLASMDAEAVVGVHGEDLDLYAGMSNVRPVLAREPEALVAALLAAYPDCFEPAPPGPEQARSSAAPAARKPTPFPPRPGAGPPRAPLPPGPPRPPGTAPRPGVPPTAAPAPWAQAQPSGVAASGRPAQVSPAERSSPLDLRGLVERAASVLSASSSRDWVPEELVRLALSNPTGRVVSVGSRAGGVGKTAIAAALGIIYGEAVQDSGWCAAVVDQNIGNPDQWGRLSLSAQVMTVSEIMSDIEAGREWSVPAWNRTPALAVYPERRDGTEGYDPGLIARFATELRQFHVLSVIDLPNRIPALSSAEAAVCAGWVAVSDLLLLPTTDDPTRLQGVLDYLDAPLVRGDAGAAYRRVRVVVPYIRSSLRAVRDDPGVRAMVEEVRARVHAVVEIPRNERATLAIVRGQPITEVDAGLRAAYVQLALTVARALREG